MAQTGHTELTLMTVEELRPLLRLSRLRPIHCAICMTKEGVGVVLLSRRMKPRRLLAQLRREAEDRGMVLNSALLRFGRATVDGSSDSKEVRFTVNRSVPGSMHHALLHHLRPAGYQRCEIDVDDRLDHETDDDVEDEQADDEHDAIESSSTLAAGPNATSIAADPEMADVTAIRGLLKALVEDVIKVVANEPGRKQELLALATAGQQSLLAGDVQEASRAARDLRAALHPGG